MYGQIYKIFCCIEVFDVSMSLMELFSSVIVYVSSAANNKDASAFIENSKKCKDLNLGIDFADSAESS